MKFDDLLKYCVDQGASDVHLHAGMAPHVRVNGHMKSLGSSVLPPAITESFAAQMCNDRQRALFAEKNQVDLAYSVHGVARFRVNLFRQRGSVSAVLRVINSSTADFSKVNVPEDIMQYIASQKRGIVLVTGPTGSGKSTTLAATLDRINETRDEMIITIEDPIEMLHKNKKSVVVQREIGADAVSFADALVAAMRQDPDVIMIGEIRDYATANAAISAAQTGHLVFSTLHTMDTIRTVNRVMELFPPHERAQARVLFAESVVAIISQRLLPKADESGRVAALEILKGTMRVKEMIKDEERTPELKDVIKDGREDGMMLFDDHLARLYADGQISMEIGFSAATTPHEFKLMAQDAEARKNIAKAEAQGGGSSSPFQTSESRFGGGGVTTHAPQDSKQTRFGR
jgi:twitching motility protein PilT